MNKYGFSKWIILEKERHWKVKFDISKLFIQCNKDSCYELITVGVNIYFYGCVNLLGADSAVCLCICVYMCVSCVCVRSYQSTSKKADYVSDLSKLIVCTRPRPPPPPFFGVGPPTGKEGLTLFRWAEGCSFYRKN